MNKLIFLDIDGVLNSAEHMKESVGRVKKATSFFERSVEQLNAKQVQMMSNFANEMDAQVVISSTWRILHDLKEIMTMLTSVGWYETPIIGVTPRHSTGFRGTEVEMWLQDNVGKDTPNYVIFDDDSDFYDYQPLVKTSWEIGLQPEQIAKAREILT